MCMDMRNLQPNFEPEQPMSAAQRNQAVVENRINFLKATKELAQQGKLSAQHRVCRIPWDTLIIAGHLEIGENAFIDEDVWLCHSYGDGKFGKVVIGKNCYIRSGTVIYGDVTIGDNTKTGHHVVIRNGCRIGHDTSIGTGVKIENDTQIGNFVSIETQSHITANMQIDDYVFVGGFVGSTNDYHMKYKRPGHGENLKGAHIKEWARIGSGAILMPGIIIGEHSIINVGEVVRKDVPDNTLMATVKGRTIHKLLKGHAKELINQEISAIALQGE